MRRQFASRLTLLKSIFIDPYWLEGIQFEAGCWFASHGSYAGSVKHEKAAHYHG